MLKITDLKQLIEGTETLVTELRDTDLSLFISLYDQNLFEGAAYVYSGKVPVPDPLNPILWVLETFQTDARPCEPDVIDVQNLTLAYPSEIGIDGVTEDYPLNFRTFYEQLRIVGATLVRASEMLRELNVMLTVGASTEGLTMEGAYLIPNYVTTLHELKTLHAGILDHTSDSRYMEFNEVVAELRTHYDVWAVETKETLG